LQPGNKKGHAKTAGLVRESCRGALPLKSPRDGFAGDLNLTDAQKRIATLLGGDAWAQKPREDDWD